MGDAIRILIADDHPVVRQGLRTFLGSLAGIELVGEAANTEQVVLLHAGLQPDVVLLDLVMPGGGGIEAIRRIRTRDPAARVLVLTSFASDDQVLPALQAGAAGYLMKDADPADLERAIRAVHAGQSTLHPEAATKVVAQVHRSGPSALEGLTTRERQVLALLAEGLTNRQLARRLTVSEKTVKTHVSNVLRKLGVADRTQAALLAAREGLADRDR